MSLKSKCSPAKGEFLFAIDPQPLEDCVTAFSGCRLFVRAARNLDVPGIVKRHLHVKQRDPDEATSLQKAFWC
jgi:hypothetical protein